MFNVGDIVICKDNRYLITDSETVCKVIELINSVDMRVEIIDTKNENNKERIGNKYYVEQDAFRLVKEPAVENAEEDCGYIPLDEKTKKEIAENIIRCLEHYEYQYNEDVIYKMVEKWYDQKEKVMRPFRKLKEWNNKKFFAVWKNDYERCVNIDKVNEFKYEVLDYYRYNMKKQMYFNVFTYHETMRIYNTYIAIRNYFDDPNVNLIYYKGIKYTRENLDKIKKDIDRYRNELDKYGRSSEDVEQKKIYNGISSYLTYIVGMTENEDFKPTLTQEQADRIKELAASFGCEVRPREGEKLTKSLKRIMTFAGITESPDYNAWISKLGDAINPIKYQKYTVISFNPVDYLRMSMGDSWASCHTIDKANIDNRDGDTYEGMHANGTISYMLDNCSCVFYTVSPDYDGENFEWQNKNSRQMYHLGTKKNPIMIQGRLYPQSNDYGAGGLYSQIRNFMQDTISKVWNENNLWKTRKIKPRYDETLIKEPSSYAHYPDYFNFRDVCRLSYINDNITEESFSPITIGSKGMCIECGDTNTEPGEINCCHYYNRHTCSQCGETSDNLNYIDGEYYCDDCCFYCNYHQEWEIGYRENQWNTVDDLVCEYAYENYYMSCDDCGEVRLRQDMLYLDGRYYCDDDCAIDDGWIYLETDGEWHREEDLVFCEVCCNYVLKSEYNFEQNCCENCNEKTEEE